jgi:proteasome lid subunit RPN8/RPN11
MVSSLAPADRRGARAFRLTLGICQEILAHARAGFPEEVCGIVSGKEDEAVALYRGRNISPTPRVAYELDVETLTKQIEFDDVGLTLAAIYHSHPAGPETPSETDIARATYPDSVYLICCLADLARPSLRGFRIVASQVWEVALSEATT